MADDDPLSEMYTDERPHDREQAVETLSDFVQVDQDTGEPVPQSEFQDATLEKRIVALLLYRQIAAELGELGEDEIPVDQEWLKTKANAEHTVPGTWDLEFIRETKDGHKTPPHSVDAALEYLEGP